MQGVRAVDGPAAQQPQVARLPLPGRGRGMQLLRELGRALQPVLTWGDIILYSIRQRDDMHNG